MSFSRLFVLVGLLFLAEMAPAQFTDDFSDGDISNNPTWLGQPGLFEITAGQLHLQAPAEAGQTYLVTGSKAIESAQWEFYVKLDFNPSSNNLAKIYVVSDRQDLLAPLNGYYVRVGGTVDEVSLYRQTGASVTKIIDGQDDRIDVSSVTLRVKVTRSASGQWALFSDPTGGTNYTSEGTVTDATFITSAYFGLVCQYTATRSDKFYFDDLIVTRQPFQDTTAPELTNLAVLSNQQLRLDFSEPIAAASASNGQNYQVNNSIGSPVAAALQNDHQVLLSFDPGFPNGQTNQLSVKDIRDLSGNPMVPISREFRYFKSGVPAFLEVVMHEIMADPDPALALPTSEYIELFNRGDQVLDLAGWTLADLTSEVTLPTTVLFPRDHIIICPADQQAAFSVFGPTLGLSSWPTLNNDGDQLSLKDPLGNLIHQVSYDASWYRSTFKKDGGWSLEMIDAEYPCSGSKNWIAADNEMGGTPGAANSVAASNPDLTGPQLRSAFAASVDQVVLQFDEPLQISTIPSATYQVDQGITAQFLELKGLQQVVLTVTPALVLGEVYQITIENITDCNGNGIDPAYNSGSFSLPETADSLDLVINEILFNPRSLGVRFVEVYNRSTKYINLKNWRLANQDSGIIANTALFLEGQDLVIAPGTFKVITTSPSILKGEYPRGLIDTFIETPTLPSYPNDAGTVVLLNPSGHIIDWFDYQEDFHYPLLNDREGVSLERLSFEAPSNDPNNWKSAASTVGFATPGYKNSQTLEGNAPDVITIDPKVFSFNQVGGPYFTTIHYRFDNFGNAANVEIFDSQGRSVRKIAENDLLQAEGFFTWDGTNDRGQKVNTGYYLILFEVFNLNGAVNVYKETVAFSNAF